MKIIIGALTLFLSFNSFCDVGLLQNMEGSDLNLVSDNKINKELNLDNPFVIQLYSNWKRLGTLNGASTQWIELILNKEYEKALLLLPSINEKKISSLKEPSELYLLYQTGNTQTFFMKWIDLASSSSFLQSEFGLALDQMIGNKTGSLLAKDGLFLTAEASSKLKKIENEPSKINTSLQALNALRTRENALAWIGKLSDDDPLRMPLAQTALLHYAKEGKLGASGKIIKNIIEPILNKKSSEEDLSLYFMTLGRLLYQANALEEAKKYYELIPESSSYFLKAKTESLWVYLKARDFSRTKGELATLELNLFNDKFYPEAYLVSAMANVLLCQFNEARAAINRFINVNKAWAKEIDRNLKDKNPQKITTNFFITNIEKAKQSLARENENIKNKKLDPDYNRLIEKQITKLDEALKEEIVAEWSNRKKILESALYKMQFVKIELIARMRKVEMNMKVAEADELTIQNAAPLRKNQISFPKDGALWGDELFLINASVINKCIKGNLK